MKKEIEIQEGYEAKIEGNKVVFILKESEIRREILSFLKEGVPYCCPNSKRRQQWVAYLEKQKEPEWCHHKVDLSGCSEEYRKAYYDGWNNCNQQHSQLQAEQKPAEWSEEDELNKDSAIRFLNTFAYARNLFDENGEITSHDLRSCVNWLKSLRPQPKQEWNEEEQDTINLLIAIVEKNFDHDKAAFKWGDGQYLSRDEVVNRIKSLRPQPHWKPSEKQMRALALFRSSGRVINSLYNDLKKL